MQTNTLNSSDIPIRLQQKLRRLCLTSVPVLFSAPSDGDGGGLSGEHIGLIGALSSVILILVLVILYIVHRVRGQRPGTQIVSQLAPVYAQQLPTDGGKVGSHGTNTNRDSRVIWRKGLFTWEKQGQLSDMSERWAHMGRTGRAEWLGDW